MKIPYGKRRYVPDHCPKCGKTTEVIASPMGSGLPNQTSFCDMLTVYFTAWTPVLAEHPSEAFKGTPWWWGHCGICTMTENVFTPLKDTLFMR